MNQESRIKNQEIQGTKKRSMFYILGFTIVEMIVSVAVFSIVIVFSVGALLSIIDSNKQSQSMNSIVSNLNYALETMVRSIRTGSNYDCNINTSGLQECPTIPSNEISFTSQVLSPVTYLTYRLEGAKIKRDLKAGSNAIETVEMTAPEISIDRLKFYVKGSSSQPNVTILIGGKMTLKGGKETRFDIETMAVQRLFNK